jgi:prepilin-type processing-associated H-X9-DG protein
LQSANIVPVIIAVLVVLVVGVALVGRQIGIRAKDAVRAAFGLTVIAIGVNAALLLAVRPTVEKIGPIVTRQTLLLGSTLTIALLGGFAAGVARKERQQRAQTGIVLLTVLLAGIFGGVFIGRVNQVVELARGVGLLGAQAAYEPQKNKDCPENLKSLYIAFQQYAQDWDALPPAANWLDNDELVSKVSRNEWLHCPAVSNRHDNRYGYAYNTAVAGRKMGGKHALADLPDAAHTPLLYDSTDLGKNAHDALQSLPKPGRHGGRNNILYLDGHVQAVAP